jgi:hypothetical protein
VIIELTVHHPPKLVEPERVDRLHAVCHGDPKEMHYDEFVQEGPDWDHVWVDIALLRARALEQVDDPTFEQQFDNMIAYARRKEWLNALGTRLRAHVER